MTVKDVVLAIKDAKCILIAWNGLTRQICPSDTLDMDAFGKYVVSEILAVDDGVIEIGVACRPLSE